MLRSDDAHFPIIENKFLVTKQFMSGLFHTSQEITIFPIHSDI